MTRQLVEQHRGNLEREAPHVLPWLLGSAAAGYGILVAHAWWRYGRPRAGRWEEGDALLDTMMPAYDVVERHRIRVHAPPHVTLEAATTVDLFQSRIARVVFKTRERVMGAERQAESPSSGLLDYARSLGWGVLAEEPGREIVMGAVTQPWKANVTFRSVPPNSFREFSLPDHVKIAWTLRADPIGHDWSIFRTETRAVATDPGARAKFRRYWALVSPGVWLIRRLMLRPVKREAERGGRR
jgi:hypothetical protein